MVVRVDGCGSSGDGFKKEVSIAVLNVKAVPPYMVFSNKSPRKYGAKLEGKLMGSGVVGVDI